jgi:hypothetical protein
MSDSHINLALGRAPELPLGQGRCGFPRICLHNQFCAVLNIPSLLTAAVPLPLRLSRGAGIAVNFRCAVYEALGEAAGSIHGTLAAFTEIVSRFGFRQFALHRERDDGEEPDAKLPVGRREG